jgi:discoidin domain receptor family protein 2
VFSEARIYFSIGGKIFSKEPITLQTKEDCIFEDPKNVSIKLHHRIGQYVKLQLFWATKWMLISELTFDSRKLRALLKLYFHNICTRKK